MNEAVHQWLPPLLDSNYIADKVIDEAIRNAQKKGRQMACAINKCHWDSLPEKMPDFE